ncbi:hypothetical protein ETD86_35325 [Nonomuraea turkmeniaca]|uniref:Lipoprotein n=1 Tax=Nonomuraea turkmeniaca TaxID=103838 RepID=A0A5S4F627_9ACTN|nr:hypothetical protein [Nonomuraea turkmeniaca]TMR11565.1 hypothetical protein ETD86_35325 [Nonomuraea turkmeniaca]
MRRIPALLTGTIATAALLAGLGGTGLADQVPSAPVAIGDTKIGKILVDGEGRTLYLFERDTEGKSTCYGGCAENWPPYLTDGEPTAEEGTKADLLSTTNRKDGSEQVVYGKWPLYYYHEDKKPGDTFGHDIDEFGAEWYALQADGKKASH